MQKNVPKLYIYAQFVGVKFNPGLTYCKQNKGFSIYLLINIDKRNTTLFTMRVANALLTTSTLQMWMDEVFLEAKVQSKCENNKENAFFLE